MSQKAMIHDHGLKHDTLAASEGTKSAVQLLVEFKCALSKRIKDWLAKVLTALKGDYEFHNYLGM